MADARTVTYTNGDTLVANVPLAAGANPTKAEFDALINALIAAGIMAAAEED